MHGISTWAGFIRNRNMSLTAFRNVRVFGLVFGLLLQGPATGQNPEDSRKDSKSGDLISPPDLVAKLKKSKNSPHYVFHDDALYQELVRISETRPTYGPTTGVGDAGSFLASCVIKPAAQAGPGDHPYFIASISRRTSIGKNGELSESEVKSLYLIKVQQSESTFRYQCIGSYREKENLEKILQALRKAAGNPPFKKGSKDFDVPNTAVFRGFIDKALYEEISRIPERYPKLEDHDQTFDPDGISFAEITVKEALFAPVQIRTKETYWKLLLSEDERIALFQYRRDGSYCDYELRKIGVFRATAEWENICHRIAEKPKDSEK